MYFSGRSRQLRGPRSTSAESLSLKERKKERKKETKWREKERVDVTGTMDCSIAVGSSASVSDSMVEYKFIQLALDVDDKVE